MKTFERIFSIPQMLLMALAYRLIGKRYSYTFGQNGIRAIDEVTPKERAFVLLFPMVLLGTISVISAAIWIAVLLYLNYPLDPIAYYLDVSLLWHQLFWWIGLICFGYASMSILNLPYIFKLLRSKNEDSKEYPNDGGKHHGTRDNHQNANR